MFRLPRIPEPHRGENFDWRLQSPSFYVTSNICNILYVRGFFVRISQDKQKKLAYVARRYYLEDQKQSDIARELGVSRPLVSRMLSEARELGIVEITIHEGRKRQVKRMLEAVGHPVLRLHRESFGPLELGSLPEGKYRVLSSQEIVALEQAAR